MITRTREEHIQYCKDNAYKQYEYDMSDKEYSKPDFAIGHTLNTLIADLIKHPETHDLANTVLHMSLGIISVSEMRLLIDSIR